MTGFAALNTAVLGLASLAAIWGIADIVTKRKRFSVDRGARIVMNIGLALFGYAGIRSASPMGTPADTVGIGLVIAASILITVLMRKLADANDAGAG